MKTRKERAEYVGRKLEELYPENPIPLDHTDAFTLLIAVLLSARLLRCPRILLEYQP